MTKFWAAISAVGNSVVLFWVRNSGQHPKDAWTMVDALLYFGYTTVYNIGISYVRCDYDLSRLVWLSGLLTAVLYFLTAS